MNTETPHPAIEMSLIHPEFDKQQLPPLLSEFRASTRRAQDKSLATRLEEEVLQYERLHIRRQTIVRLAKWCKTDGRAYQDGMVVARKISLLIFGRVLRREDFGV